MSKAQYSLPRVPYRLAISIPILTLFLGLFITFASAYYIYYANEQKERQEFITTTKIVNKQLVNNLSYYNNVLYVIRALFYTKNPINQHDFQSFVSNLQLEKEYPSIEGIGSALSFPGRIENQIVSEVRQNGLDHFTIHPATVMDTKTVAVYLEPLNEINKTLIGFDLMSRADFRLAIEQARDTGQAVSTGKVDLNLSSELPEEPGFYIFLPRYRSSETPTTINERRNQIVGFVFMIVNSQEFVDKVFNESSLPISFSIHDDQSTDDNLLFSNVPEDIYQPTNYSEDQIEMLGHNWRIYYENKAAADITSIRNILPPFILAGCLISLAVFAATSFHIKSRIDGGKMKRKLAEMQSNLKSTEERLRLLIQEAKEYAMIMVNKNGQIVSWNSGAEYLFGYSQAETLNKNYSIFFSTPDKQKRLPRRILTESLQNGSTEFEMKFVKKNNTRFWASGVISPAYDKNNSCKGFTLIARDISQRKRTEVAMIRNQNLTQAVLSSLSVGIAVIDQSGQIIAVNSAWNNPKADEASKFPLSFDVGDNYLISLQKTINKKDQYIDRSLQGIQKVLTGKQKQFSIEYPVLDKTKEEENWYLLQVNPLLGDNGGVVISYTNITKQKKLEKQKDEFLTIASHELKTPITTTKAYAQVLIKMLNNKSENNVSRILHKMDQQINKITQLINDLLDVSKVEAGLLKLNREYFEFDVLINEVVESIQLTSQKHKILIQDKSNKRVYADREKVAQVLINLLGNAIKYSPKANRVIIKIQANQEYLKVLITDFGLGIPVKDQAHLFQRFFRISSNEFKGFPGLGLGLYISAEIIKRLGGQIGVDSTPGKSSTFYFTIPLEKT
ncbi:MAG: CHASE domain-containing protein [Patescibacteria group bacterium]